LRETCIYEQPSTTDLALVAIFEILQPHRDPLSPRRKATRAREAAGASLVEVSSLLPI
jgi:hypothetical protein